jgi:hypothetical protein
MIIQFSVIELPTAWLAEEGKETKTVHRDDEVSLFEGLL